MTYHGHIKNGAVVLDDPVNLPEGAEVRVDLVPEVQPQNEDEGPTLYERLKDVIGQAKGLPPDAALNHDHYLHGRPKK
jgi:hypothetical protein